MLEDGTVETRKVEAKTLEEAKEAAEEVKKEDREVEIAEPQYLFKLHDTPNDPRYDPEQSYLDVEEFDAAWEVSKGSGVKIAVLDSGIYANHEDIGDKLVGERDFTGDTPDNDADPYDYHGTATSGIAVAKTSNGQGIAGAGWRADLLHAKVCREYCKNADIAQGLDWAASRGAKVVSMSFGGQQDAAIMRAAIERASDNDIVLVTSTGNDYGRADNYPACNAEVIGVGALSNGDQNVANYSTTGPCVDVVARGSQVMTTNWPQDVGSGDRLYRTFNGTSFAAPQVAGLAALVRAFYTGETAEQVSNNIMTGADDLGPAGRDNEYGHGRIDGCGAFRGIPNPTPCVVSS